MHEFYPTKHDALRRTVSLINEVHATDAAGHVPMAACGC